MEGGHGFEQRLGDMEVLLLQPPGTTWTWRWSINRYRFMDREIKEFVVSHVPLFISGLSQSSSYSWDILMSSPIAWLEKWRWIYRDKMNTELKKMWFRSKKKT